MKKGAQWCHYFKRLSCKGIAFRNLRIPLSSSRLLWQVSSDMEDELKFYRHFNFHVLKSPLLFGTPTSSPLLYLELMWLLPFLYQKMYPWVLVYIPNRLYCKNSSFLHFLNLTKLHHLFIPALLSFSTLCKTYFVLTLVWILLDCCLSPIHLKTIKNHWMVISF